MKSAAGFAAGVKAGFSSHPAGIAAAGAANLFPPESNAAPWRRLHVAAAWALLFLSFFCWGGRSLWESSEARYGEVAREMLRGGDWLIPHLHGHPHVTKPPFAYWTMAGSMAALGVNDWGVRLPLCIAFAGTVLCLWKLALAMGFTRAEALCSAAVFATGGFSYAASFALTTDPILCFWISFDMLGLWRSWTRPSIATRAMLWGGFGLAFLTKGPPAWLHLAAIPAFLLLRRGRQPMPSLRAAMGVPAMLAIGLSWFVAAVSLEPSRLSYFLGREIADRVLTNEFDRNHPVWTYGAILMLGPFPWALLWPCAFRDVAAALRAGRRHVPDDWLLFCCLWIALPLIVFCIARSRMPLYVLPLFQPMALVLGRTLARTMRTVPRWAAPRRALAAAALAAWTAALLASRVLPDSTVGLAKAPRAEADLLRPAFAEAGVDVRAYWFDAKPLHSVAFYLDRTIADPGGLHMRDLPKLAEADIALGRRVLFVTERDEIQRLERRGQPIRVPARGELFHLFEFVDATPQAPASDHAR